MTEVFIPHRNDWQAMGILTGVVVLFVLGCFALPPIVLYVGERISDAYKSWWQSRGHHIGRTPEQIEADIFGEGWK